LIIITSSCSKKEETPAPASSQTPAPTYGGRLVASSFITYNGPLPVYSGSYTAAFYDNGALVNAGTIKANNTTLTFASNQYSYTIPTSTPSFPCQWKGTGSSSVEAFDVTTKTFTGTNTFNPDTIFKSQAFFLSHSTITADSIEYSITAAGNGTSVKKYATVTTGSVTFSVSDLSALTVGATETAEISIKAWNRENKVLGTKYYVFVNSATFSRNAVLKN
ncbi:MAG TPA: hypothetical protein VGF30_01490, partial [Bacteroidia bacterium]